MDTNTSQPSIVGFSRDPLAFITRDHPEYAVVSSSNIPGGPAVQIGDVGHFKFESVGSPARPAFEIRYHGPDAGADTVSGYYLGYNAGAQRSWTPARIDIPKIILKTGPQHELHMCFSQALSRDALSW
ncbi:hypothetical protein MGU_08317 [Metarhizium guizhouense ARSEF 977]|uniref:Uncharacterized protein n=1 Tax=Metarhizium guizhouense (strain ARSEF 977) TaxID=1276136 RepID=A0A0B4HXY5_METGA|nr:hypothetical protein MGU_08317 [Metarhizium guizhouense ARSEF 977]